MKTTRINTGLYQLAYSGQIFQIEDAFIASDGEALPGWIVYRMKGDRRVYCNDYITKRAAVRGTMLAVDAGY